MLKTILASIFLSLPGVAVAGDCAEDENKRIAENEHIYSEQYVGHAGDQNYTRAQDRAAVEGWKTFSPEGKMTIQQIVAEGDLVAVLWTGEGINTGEGNGLPATGKPFRATAMTMFRLADGNIVEE